MVRFVARGWWPLFGVSLLLCACNFDESGQGAAVSGGQGPAGAGGGMAAGSGGAGAGAAGAGAGVGGAGAGGLGGASPVAGQGGSSSTPPAPAPDAAGTIDTAGPADAAPPADAPPIIPPPLDAASDPTPPILDVAPPPAAPGPVGHWRFDDGSGVMAADASGSGNHGTLLGGPEFVNGFPAKFANLRALSFDGDDDQVVAGVNRLPAPQSPKTISLWVRAPILSVGTRAFVSLTNRSVSCGLHVGTKGVQLAAWKWGGDPLVSRLSPPGASWHHVLYTFDGVGHTLRVDGGPPEFSNIPTQSCTLTHLVIGNYEGGGNFFQGSLDDVRIWDRVLTEVEARALADGREAP
jgi:hypothetical protein